MNTIGKILVVLNFVFAIVVGGLLVVDFAARNKWKDAHDALKREAEAVKLSRDEAVKVTKTILADLAQKQLDIDKYKLDKEALEIAKTVAQDKYNLDVLEYQQKLLDKDTTLNLAAAAKQRLSQEIELLNKTIKDREKSINEAQTNIKVLTVKALSAESTVAALKEQNENLLERLRLAEVKLARLEGGLNPDADPIRNPNAPNPPATLVNSKIEKVDGDLVQIPLGTDHGLNKNNTLDVYRTQPEPKYLGMIRIVDANHHKSVARFVTTGPQARPQLKEGDLVTSKLTR